MKKINNKIVVTIASAGIATSLLAPVAAFAQSQGQSATVSQSQQFDAPGAANVFHYQQSHVFKQGSQANLNGATQEEIEGASGVQAQGGHTSGPADASQSQSLSVAQHGHQGDNRASQASLSSSDQSVSTPSAAHILQLQIGMNASSQYQVSFANNGPTYQGQHNIADTVQFQMANSTPAPEQASPGPQPE